jgi:anaerobic selenocysteine-containing dehydrogenase
VYQPANRCLDTAFIAEHTDGFEAFVADIRQTAWDDILSTSGLPREQLERVARVYMQSQAVIACYGMGITQHRLGTENVQQLANLLFLRGNIGRPGAGICPVRGHSNVQGVGIDEKPTPEFLDRLGRVFGFDPPRTDGHHQSSP